MLERLVDFSLGFITAVMLAVWLKIRKEDEGK